MRITESYPENSPQLHADYLSRQAKSLREAVEIDQALLVEREEAIARLSAQIALLKASLRKASADPVVPAETGPVPAKEAAMDSASFTTASLPRTVSRRSFAPYAAIAACALALEFGGPRRPAAAASDLSALVYPAPGVVENGRPAAKGAPILADDDRSEEALLLVHEWRLPGDDKPLGERLGRELELPGGRPAWSVERTGAQGYRVTFQPAEKDLPYSFDADIEARVVWPAPETQELLAPSFTAAFRDSAR